MSRGDGEMASRRGSGPSACGRGHAVPASAAPRSGAATRRAKKSRSCRRCCRRHPTTPPRRALASARGSTIPPGDRPSARRRRASGDPAIALGGRAPSRRGARRCPVSASLALAPRRPRPLLPISAILPAGLAARSPSSSARRTDAGLGKVGTAGLCSGSGDVSRLPKIARALAAPAHLNLWPFCWCADHAVRHGSAAAARRVRDGRRRPLMFDAYERRAREPAAAGRADLYAAMGLRRPDRRVVPLWHLFRPAGSRAGRWRDMVCNAAPCPFFSYSRRLAAARRPALHWLEATPAFVITTWESAGPRATSRDCWPRCI